MSCKFRRNTKKVEKYLSNSISINMQCFCYEFEKIKNVNEEMREYS